MKNRIHTSALSELIYKYIRHMQEDVKRSFRTEAYILLAYDNYCTDHGILSPLNENAYTEYCHSGDITLNQRGKRYRILYNFHKYLRASDPTLPAVHEQRISEPRPNHICHVYTPDEERALLDYPFHPSCKWHDKVGVRWQCILGILIATGMRIGEVLGLKIADIDFKEHILAVRGGKFRKDRLVPVSKSVIDAIERFLPHRMKPSSPYLFTSWRSDRYRYGGINGLFNEAVRELGICAEAVSKPRLHDFRHTFAHRQQIAWMEEGRDVNELLPILATYLGHTHFSDTVHYLESSAEILRPLAAKLSLLKEAGI